MGDMAREELAQLEEEIPALEREIQLLLLPKDPDEDKNVVMEIRGGAGGEEAALFGTLLMRMYTRYAERHGWRVEILSSSMTELGGVKEAVYNVTGVGAYKLLKYESGVHRVQRVPATETQGRIHTSAATVAVLPEAEEVEVEINDKDIRIDIFHSGGAGGQNVNKVASAVRITHFPTGIVVTCQDERSQLKNKERAFKVLRSRIYDFYNGQNAKAREENRRSMVGTGDRSERIRTYNYPQSRVTDHRIGLSQYNLDAFLTGDIDSMVEALAIADREALLSSQES
jgi:peptide chain release factor 1